MTALSADKRRVTRNVQAKATAQILLADSQTVYEGALIMINASGLAVVGADTASMTFGGVAAAAVTSGSSNTTKYVDIEYGHEEWFEKAGAVTVADIGANLVIADDATITDAGAGANDVLVGQGVQLETINGTAGVWLRVRQFA